MSRRLLPSPLVSFAIFGIGVLASSPARAECASDADCAQGMVCEVTGGTGCTASACAPGETCPDPPPCEPQEFKDCVPGPCQTDSDCGAGLVCVTTTSTLCTMQDCAPNTDCPAPTCVDQTESRCAPPYVAPCEADADCGEGFTCEQSEVCSCSSQVAMPPAPSGAGGTSATDGTAGAATRTTGAATGTAGATSDECSCSPSGERYCKPKTYACETSANCPSGWTCESNPAQPACAPASGAAGAPAADCGAAADMAQMVCEPPFWSAVSNGALEIGAAPATDYAASDGAASQSTDSSGCQLSPGGARTGIGMLFGLGAVALAFGRRRRVGARRA